MTVPAPDSLVAALRPRGYEPEDEAFAVGRPDRRTIAVRGPGGEALVAKQYPEGSEKAFAVVQELWGSSFGVRRDPPGLARPVEHLAEAGVVVMERVPGRTMVELGDDGERHVEAAIALLADLHASEVRPERRRAVRGVVRSMERKAADVRRAAPVLAGGFDGLVMRLREVSPPDVELRPGHGDFSARNVLVSADRLVLIDWDRVCRADPARDVAYLGAWAFAHALRSGRDPSWQVLDRAVEAYETVRPSAAVGARIRFYAAAGLARIVHSIVVLWPGDLPYAPALVGEAEALLQ